MLMALSAEFEIVYTRGPEENRLGGEYSGKGRTVFYNHGDSNG